MFHFAEGIMPPKMCVKHVYLKLHFKYKLHYNVTEIQKHISKTCKTNSYNVFYICIPIRVLVFQLLHNNAFW